MLTAILCRKQQQCVTMCLHVYKNILKGEHHIFKVLRLAHFWHFGLNVNFLAAKQALHIEIQNTETCRDMQERARTCREMQGNNGTCRKYIGTQGNTGEYKEITENIGEYKIITREMCR